MRELKFRAWDKENKKMYIVDLLNEHGQACFKDYDSLDVYEGDIVMQYTGLKDKNGKEIYEGDIIGYKDINGKIAEKIHVEMQWDSRMSDYCIYGFVFGSRFMTPEKSEVIGNIYENPEM